MNWGNIISMKKKINNSSKSNSLYEGLKLMRRCPLCKKDYDLNSVCILRELSDTHLVHITCQECLGAVLVVVIVSALGMSSVGVVTDLGAEDARKIQNKDAFSEDDVLGFYNFLESSHNFEKILMM